MSFMQAGRLAVKAARLGKHAHDLNKAIHKADEHPVAAGMERLMAYGTIIYTSSGQHSLVTSGKDEDKVRSVLADTWRVTDYASANQTLAWLRDHGQRQDYSPWVRAALYSPAADQNVPQPSYFRMVADGYKAAFSKHAAETQQADRVSTYPDFAQTFFATVDGAQQIFNCIGLIRAYLLRSNSTDLPITVFQTVDNVDALDIERIGNVARLSFEAGYLPENEAYNWLGVADQMTRGRYHSWQQYCAAWLIGQAFWTKNPDLFFGNTNLNGAARRLDLVADGDTVDYITMVVDELRTNRIWQAYPLG